MNRSLKVIIAGVLIVAGLTGCVVFLTGQGLDRAAQWVSIVGTVVSVVVGVAGLVLAWQARPGTGPSVPGRGRVTQSGVARADGQGSQANTGIVGPGGSGGSVSGTGDATATGGGWANTGEDHR